jgi:hypothetical protein
MVVGMLLLSAVGAGADRVAELVVTLREGQADQRSEACDALVSLGPMAARAALRKMLRSDPDRMVQDAVAVAIREIGPGR